MTEINEQQDQTDDSPTFSGLFITFFRIGLFTLGGGLAMATVMRHELVLKKSWLSEEEFMLEMSTSTLVPGAIAINMAYLQGRRLLGTPGALAAIAGTVIPSFSIILFIAFFAVRYFENPRVAAFLKGCGIAVTGQLAFAVLIFGRKHLRNFYNLIICMIALFAVAYLHWHPVAGVLTAGMLGLFLCSSEPASDSQNDSDGQNDI